MGIIFEAIFSALNWKCHICGKLNAIEKNNCTKCGHEFCDKCTGD